MLATSEPRELVLQAVPARSHARGVLAIARRKPLGTAALLLLLALWFACLLAPVIAPYGWDELFVGPKLEAPSSAHLFGTDSTGRDVYSRVLYGGRITLTISLVATLSGITIASVLGILSAYAGGLADLTIQRVSDAIQAMPALVVLLVVATVFRQNPWATIAALSILTAPSSARVLRSQVISVRGLPYVESAHTVGCSHKRILTRHVLPNVAHLIIILFTIGIGANMLVLTTLSFLGVVSPSTPDWGTMLSVSAQQYLIVAPWTAIFPGLAISLGVLGYNLVGDALRDVLDPRLRGA
jgi:peptide/nickel transport system permease protein